VIGAKETSAPALQILYQRGYSCASVDSPEALLKVAPQLKPEAILVSGGGKLEQEALAAIRQNGAWAQLPMLADLTGAEAEAVRELPVAFDDHIYAKDELARRLEAALRAKRLIERDAFVQLRMEMLLEIAKAATSSLELDQILRIAVEKISRVITADRCSIILVEGIATRHAQVVASQEAPDLVPLQVDLLRYPELRRALEIRESVYIEDAERDPIMTDVRSQIATLGVKSILVQPLISHDDLLGALFLRLSRSDASFGREEQEFARAVAAALANSIRNARLHSALKRKREDLESAYVDRYRELVQANQRLKELNRLKDDMIAICSHDLRAPLQVLLGHGRLLLEAELPQAQKTSADAIERQGKKILGLVESLLERGHREGGQLSLKPTLQDISALCKESVEELRILAEERGVSLRPETSESLMAIADETKIREVLQNLITNAINHARDAGEVRVRAQRLKRPDGDAARVVVRDDGAGIPNDELHLVFDRYRHGPGGTGLGLAICKEFIEVHGGEIWAENAPEGGCAFVFTVPLARTTAAPAPSATPQPDEHEQRPRVLVVEDEPEVAGLVSEILKTRYRVEIARDGMEGVAKSRMLRPDLVVMDVFLPRLDGLDAALALQNSSDTAQIPVILLSAHQGIAEKVRALNLGVVDYLTKPFPAMELLNRVDRAIMSSQLQAALKPSGHPPGNDSETGLFDRVGLIGRLQHELARSLRYQRPLSLVVLLPQAAIGDQVRTCAALIRGRLRSPDLLGHLGQGVFAMVLPESPLGAARSVCSRILPDLYRMTGVVFKNREADVAADGRSAETVLDRLLDGHQPA
jgi:signal transduction histidine kinase/DNA-binding response OmpR family regulator